MRAASAPVACAVLALLTTGCASEPSPWTATHRPPPDAPRSSDPCAVEAEPHAELKLPVWDVIIERAHWDALHLDPDAPVEVDTHVCVAGVRYPIELELHGASSRRLPKKSFDLKFNRGKKLKGWPFSGSEETAEPEHRRILLKAMFHDQSLIREAIAFDLFRAMGGEAPRLGFANLRINGAYWGLYALVEPINEEYLLRRGYPAHGRLYKATRKHGSYADFEPGRNLKRAFEDKELDDWPEDALDEEHHKASEGRADLERLVRALQKTPLTDEAFAEEIDPFFPLDRYFDRLIWVSWTQNGDATAQNYYLYNAPQGGHDHWHQIPWDSNLCFGADWEDMDAVRPPHAGLLIDGRNYFSKRLVRVPGVRARYFERYRKVLDEVLTPSVVYERFEHYSTLVEQDLAADQARWKRNIAPSEAFDALVDFFEARPDALRDALAELEDEEATAL